jgi:pyrimidine operon attenuation protein/uracil phosphoribosyltransferase
MWRAGPVREEIGADQLRRTLKRLSHEIIEQIGDPGSLALVGIRTRGVTLAERLARTIEELARVRPPVGALDVTLYRDDLDREGGARRRLRKTDIPFSCEGKDIVLVDDVLFTGRTVRAALAALVNFGRPGRVLLAVAVDRGGRELPVRADFVGRNMEVLPDEEVQVFFEESDGRDAIVVQDSPDFAKRHIRKDIDEHPAAPEDSP